MIQVYRNNAPITKLPLTQQVMFNHEIMGDKSVVFDVKMSNVIDIRTRDYILFETEQFELNMLPNYTKESNWSHQYRLRFESIIFRLYNRRFMLNRETIFPFFGTAREHLELMVACINEIDPGWTVGIVDDTEPFHSNWNGVSCRVALTNIAEQSKLEWSNNGKELNMVKQVGRQTTISLSYGKGNGLYNLSRQSVDNTQIVTRMYGYGGTRNLPVSYGGRRLRLPESYLEANVDMYGIIEGEFVNEEIFPKREATLTSVGEITAETRVFTVTDTTINFNLNDHLLEGITAKIAFNSGDLTGYEFEIKSYNDATKTISVVSDVSENDVVMPNATLKPAVGDKYVLLDIDFPQPYVTDAINKLRTATQENLNTNKWPQVIYSFNSDVLDMKRKGWRLNPGDIVNIKDSGINLDNDVRIYAVSYPLTFALQGRLEPGTSFTATLSDSIPYTTEEKIIKDTIDNQKGIVIVDRRNTERARRNAFNLRQLRDIIFDPDDYFDMTNIRPGSIETLYLSVGAKSQNFGLNDVNINANTNADANHLTISAGSLIHFEISIDGLGYVWQMSSASFPALDPTKFYYVAARCSRTSLTGQWVISENKMKTDEDPGVWYFNLGVLYAVKDRYRSFDFTKGMTFIVGDRIKSGIIESLDGLNFFDLTQGKFNLGDASSGIDWDVTSPGTLTIRGAVASSTVQVGSGGFVSAGLSGISDEGDQSVRFWAGSSLADINNATFKILNNGFVFARNLKLGYGSSELGKNNGWDISPSGILSDPTTDNPDNFAIIRGAYKPVGHAQRTEFSFGTDLIPGSVGSATSLTGRLINRKLELGSPGLPTRNTALELIASGANENVALDVRGGTVNLNGNNIVVAPGKDGKNFTLDFRTGGEGWHQIEFLNGIAVRMTDVTNT